MKTTGIDINNWETVASNQGDWRSIFKTGMRRENIEKGYNWLRGGITKSKDLLMLHSLHS